MPKKPVLTDINDLTKESKEMAIKLKATGYSTTRIARVLNIRPNVLDKWLKENLHKVEKEKENLANLLEDNLRLILTALKDRIPDQIKNQSFQQIAILIGVLHDKLRLELGKSNINWAFSINVKKVEEELKKLEGGEGKV